MPQSPAARPITPTTSKAVTPPASPGGPAATAGRKGSKAPSDASKSNSNDGDGGSSAGTSLRSGSRGRAYAADGARRSNKASAAKTSKELQDAYPALFNTADMGLADWWRHRWTATTSIGRLAAVAMIALLIAATLMAAAWAIRDVLHDQRLQRHDHARHITAALLRTQEAVAAERKAALAVAAALWAAASPAQVAAATPPSITAVPSALSLQTAFDAATVVTDTAYNATIAAFIEHAVLMETVVDAAAVTPISRDTRQTTAVRPELAAGDFAHVGTRGTRNPALTSDRERLDDVVATAAVRRQLDNGNVRRYPVTGAAKAARVDPRASSFSSFNTGVGGRIDFDAFSSFRVRGLRRAVRPTLGALPVEISMDYGIVEAHLARLAARTVAMIGDADVNELLVASVAAGAASVFADAVSAAREIVDPVFQQTTAPAAYVARATDFVAAADAAETLMDEVLPAVLSADDARRLWLDSNRLVDQRAMRDLRNEVLISVLRPAAGSSLATTPSLANPAGAPAVDALSDALRLHLSVDTYHTAPGTNRYLPLTVTMLLVAGILCLFVLVEQRHYTRNVIGTQRDRSMENTIAYVAAAGAALRAFDLDAASDIIEERSAEATTSEGLATLHSRLLRCVASVKFAVPTIPALLFPERSAAAASYYAIVRRSTPSGSGGGLMDEARKAAKKRRRQGQAKEAAAAERAAAAAKVRELEEDDEAAGDGSTVPLTKDAESGGDAAASDKKSESKDADPVDGDANVSSDDDDDDDDEDDGGAGGSGKHSTEMLTVADVHNGQLNDDIWDRVQPGSEVRFAAFMHLDVSSLFEFQSSTEALDVAREYAGLLATAAEEYITLHGGVFHSLQGLTFVGSWGAAPTGDASLPPVPDECEAAARAAYALSARISTWRRQDPKLKEHFVPSIAITAGKVRVAVWNGGAARFSMAQVVGPPLARARAVLRANFHHRTAVAVDDTAADRLALRQLPSKPVELLTTAMREFAKDTATSGGGGSNKEPAASAAGTATGSAAGSEGSVAAAAATTTTNNNTTSNVNNNGTAMLHLAEEDDSTTMGRAVGGGGSAETRKTETDGRAHELISLARHRDPDLPARLAEYKAAFSLYQRGYHAEALKGFRRYTRLYGYDGSVERIQTLILS